LRWTYLLDCQKIWRSNGEDGRHYRLWTISDYLSAATNAEKLAIFAELALVSPGPNLLRKMTCILTP
jgi:hypothetical protein